MARTIFHIDVNNAFLSWTAMDRLKQGETLDLRTIPSAIAGDDHDRRGIILAKSTPAKAFGITTGEPTGMALQKCKDLVFVPPNFALYSKVSNEMFEILGQYSDRLEQFSIDEGFLDYTGMEKLFGEPLVGAKKIRDHIFDELGFTVNIGISSNKLLAKMAGELEKPNKILTLYPEELEGKFWGQPIENLFMVGRRTAPKLRKMGIRTIGELAKYPLPLLERELKSFGYTLHAYANGIDDSPVAEAIVKESMKSIGNSTTIAHNVTTKEEAYKILLALSETVSMRLRCSGCATLEVAVTLKDTDFHSYTHQKKVFNAIDCTNAVYTEAKACFDAAWKGEPLRLLGVRAGQLCAGDTTQLSFTEEDWTKERTADVAMDEIRMKYGKTTVVRSTFADGDENAYEGGKLKINNKIFK